MITFHQFKLKLSNFIFNRQEELYRLRLQIQLGAHIFPRRTKPQPLEPLTSEQLERAAAAAASPDGWKTIRPQDDREERTAAKSALRIDAAMLALIDLAPERFSWQVANLCEQMLECLDSDEHLKVMTELMGLMPISFYAEAMKHITELMEAGSREIVTMGFGLASSDIERRGWVEA